MTLMKMKEENYFPANCQNPFFLFWTFFRPKKVLCAGESYIDPFEVLKDPISVQYLFERYRKGDGIDFVGILEKLATQESYGSYDNAFITACIDFFDPYEKLKMAEALDLRRIRSGESKYLIRELFRMRYPEVPVPEKIPMPRPVDSYFADWKGPSRPEFKANINISEYDGNQRWLMWCLEQFLNMLEE